MAVRLFLHALAFALACAATTAAQSGRVKRTEPSAQPTPEQQQAEQRDAGEQEAKYALKRRGDADDAEPERDEAGNPVYFGRQVDRKARLLSKPEPVYTRRARRNAVRGTIVLRVVLAASGKVEKVTVIRGLPDGMTEEAIKAARAIKFEPAERDGRKVSQSVIIEYNFSLY
jgi:TonB family protein